MGYSLPARAGAAPDHFGESHRPYGTEYLLLRSGVGAVAEQALVLDLGVRARARARGKGGGRGF